MKKIITICFAFYSLNAFALTETKTCEERYAAELQSIYSTYKLSDLRRVTNTVIASMTPEERKEIADLSQRFNSTPFDTPEHQNEHFALQNRAHLIVRAVVTRAGFTISNPQEGSPYDAVIGEKISDDGYPEYTIEIRSLLIRPDPRPHGTIWLHREDPAHNPRHIISLGVMSEASSDYASWRSQATGKRVSGTMAEFIRSLLPDCSL